MPRIKKKQGGDAVFMGDANGKESQDKDDGNKKQKLIHDTAPSNAKRASFFSSPPV